MPYCQFSTVCQFFLRKTSIFTKSTGISSYPQPYFIRKSFGIICHIITYSYYHLLTKFLPRHIWRYGKSCDIINQKRGRNLVQPNVFAYADRSKGGLVNYVERWK